MFLFICILMVLAFGEETSSCLAVSDRPLTLDESREWSRELITSFMQHPIYDHPLMSKLSDATYPDHVFAVKFFSQQVYAFARDFRAYLGLSLAKLKCCPDVRDNLLDHIREENGLLNENELQTSEAFGIDRTLIGGIAHIDLWGMMLKELNIPPAWLNEVVELNQWMVETCLRESTTIGVAMILSIELWAGSMGVEMIPALRKAGIDTELGIFFDLHGVVDTEEHIQEIDADLISLLVNQIPENTFTEIKAFMKTMNDIRLRFWDKMHEVMMAAPPKNLPEAAEGPLCYGEKMCESLKMQEEAIANGTKWAASAHAAIFQQRVLNSIGVTHQEFLAAK